MGKSSKQTVGYWYKLLYHSGLGIGPIDAFLEFRGGDKTAWSGELTSSGTISINAPNLWGGEKDQGGIVGEADVMFGEAEQSPNTYLMANLGPQVPAWRGLTTFVFKGGRYGAMNPYPQSASYKIRKILKGWDGDAWYPEKAEIGGTEEVELIPVESSGWEYQQLDYHPSPGFENLAPPTDGWQPGTAPFGSGPGAWGGEPDPVSIWENGTILWVRRQIVVPSTMVGVVRIRIENGCVVLVDGQVIGGINPENAQPPEEFLGEFTLPAGTHELHIKSFDEQPPAGTVYLAIRVLLRKGLGTMNPAHVLYYARTHREIGREPRENLNDDSWRRAADTLYSEGFGICTAYDPAAESLEEFEQRICKLIGGSVNRNFSDGQWYLDLARGEYVLEDLPILTDDDVLEFSEQPSLLDSAINSVSVKYFDPERKESIVTPPVQAMALIDTFGTIHQVADYPEIPTGELALRVAERDLLSTSTSTRAFPLVTTRATYAWRPNTYFRLQLPKRGIADMVCILGSKETGTLRSGAIRITAAQDIYSLPETSYVEIEHGVDTRPPQTPRQIILQQTFEAPYVELAGSLPRAELAALPADVGYVLAVAVDPAISRDYTMLVAPDGGDYAEAGNGDWCPTCVVSATANRSATDFLLTGGVRLADVQIGSAALWDDEVCRVDAIDNEAGTVTLGRGCADTVPARHAANSRIWFYDGNAAFDATEYSDGETIHVKLLTNTGSRQLPIGFAAPMPLTLEQRQFRPYPPGQLRLNGESEPGYLFGEITVAWVHRDRLLQADQLVDHEMATIGPEEGTTYTIRWYLDDALIQTHSAISGTSQIYTPPADGLLRIELEAVRDGVPSWQMHVRELAYTADETDVRITETGESRLTESNDLRITE